MGRKLDTPIDKPDLTYQQIDSIRFEIPSDETSQTDVVIAKNSVRVDVTWTNYDADKNVMGRDSTTLSYPQWPQAFKDECNSLYQMIENWLEGQGIIEGSGTTETF